MTALVGLFAEIRKDGRKSAAHLIHSNAALATLESENKVRIAAHMIRRNTMFATLASENKDNISLCLTTHTYYLHSHQLNPQRPF